MRLLCFSQVIALLFASSLSCALARDPEPTAAANWQIKAGDTLIRIATNRYGNEAYAGFLEKFNKVDPGKLHVGKKLSTPDFSKAMDHSGAAKVAPKVAPLLGKVADDFGSTAKLIAEYHKGERRVEKPRKLPAETIKKLTNVRGQVTELRSAVDDSNLPDMLTKTLGVRLDKIESMLSAIETFETEQIGPFYRNSAYSINRAHFEIDRFLRELIKHARTPPVVGNGGVLEGGDIGVDLKRAPTK